MLAVTLVGSAIVGPALSRSNGDGGPEVRIGAPGTYDQPGGGIPTAPPLAGDQLPDLAAKTLAGADVTLRGLIGQPLVINIWYSACVPCAKELPEFAKVQKALGDQVRFVGLNVQDGADKAEKFAHDAGVGYEILLTPYKNVIDALEIQTTPSTLFIDATGRIVELHSSQLDAATLRSLISEKLGV